MARNAYLWTSYTAVIFVQRDFYTGFGVFQNSGKTGFYLIKGSFPKHV